MEKNAYLSILCEEHRLLAGRIIGSLAVSGPVELAAVKPSVLLVMYDPATLNPGTGYLPKDLLREIRAERVEYIDENSFALHLSSDGPASPRAVGTPLRPAAEMPRRIVVCREPVWTPPFVSVDGLRSLYDALVFKSRCRETLLREETV